MLIIAAIVIAYLLNIFGMFDLLELNSYDPKFHLRIIKSGKDFEIVLVTIDNRSFLSLKHKWLFPRSYFARAIQNLAEAKAALVILDVDFKKPSNTNPLDDKLLSPVIRNFQQVILAGMQGVCTNLNKNDHRFISHSIKQKSKGMWNYESKKLNQSKLADIRTGWHNASIQPAMVFANCNFCR